ncbi:hypothetical protein KC340_g15863 [Hortaea werneckii]|nr:hypothetical protein KC342_g17389 [Hortaea werneckii]KAI7058263.1 hypothetical protein KC339_g17675 [Hortaea werneckii]KAI7208129.1 hypothetical protein KC365_g16217 [Hortaea werneckii]KAI7295235.1 hypothetical protein KC340_g15863 [Hortaea werneckii]KAI7375420.1 hypothetical protein KC328_g15454 [Hortaea werneckii]
MGGEGAENEKPSRCERAVEGTGSWVQRHRVCTTIIAASLFALCIARDESTRRQDYDAQDLTLVGSSVFNVLFALVATGLLYSTRRIPPYDGAQRVQILTITALLTYALGLWAWQSEEVRRGWVESGEETKKPWSWAAWCEVYSQSGMEAPLLDFNLINFAMLLVGKAWGLEGEEEGKDEKLVEEGRGNEKAGLASDEKVGDVEGLERGMEDEKRGFEGFPA